MDTEVTDMLPNFLIVGTAKSGTSSLSHMLSQHPDCFFPARKEPNFFAFDTEYARGIDHYKARFSEAKNSKAIGEKSWRYSCRNVYPNALPRIVENLPHAKIIYIARHPLQRLQSLWMEFRSSGYDHADSNFSLALRSNPIFVDSSLYWTQLGAFRDHYPDDKILTLFFDDLKSDPISVFHTCCRFLEISADVSVNPEVRNVSENKSHDGKILEVLRNHPKFGKLRDRQAPPVRQRR
jgi:hypothetical protein